MVECSLKCSCGTSKLCSLLCCTNPLQRDSAGLLGEVDPPAKLLSALSLLPLALTSDDDLIYRERCSLFSLLRCALVAKTQPTLPPSGASCGDSSLVPAAAPLPLLGSWFYLHSHGSTHGAPITLSKTYRALGDGDLDSKPAAFGFQPSRTLAKGETSPVSLRSACSQVFVVLCSSLHSFLLVYTYTLVRLPPSFPASPSRSSPAPVSAVALSPPSRRLTIMLAGSVVAFVSLLAGLVAAEEDAIHVPLTRRNPGLKGADGSASLLAIRDQASRTSL